MNNRSGTQVEEGKDRQASDAGRDPIWGCDVAVVRIAKDADNR